VCRFFGYHTDYLSVYRGDGYYDYCSSYVKQEWCLYSNIDENGTSAYIANVDDYDYPVDGEIKDELNEEIITINDAEGMVHYLCVTHLFNEVDYSHNDATWQDHMMAATLTVKKNGFDMGDDEWSHPVDREIASNIEYEDGEPTNPAYEGRFCIKVSCTDLCDCSADDYTYTVYY
jgi:hypothetical protein